MPIPSNKFFPTNLQAQAAWMENFSAQASDSGTTYGLTAGEVTQIANDAAMVRFLADAAVTLGAYNDAVRSYRKGVTEDPIDGSTSPYPPDPTFTPPTAVPTGIWQRVIEFAARIKASASYKQDIGELYGIVGSPSTPTSPGSVQPTIELSAAVHGYLFSCVVSGREESDQWQCWAKSTSGGNFVLIGTATGKSSDFVYDPGQATGPVQLEVYVQLRRSNANYGQPSAIVLVTVNP